MEYFRLITSNCMKEPIRAEGLDTGYYKPNITREEFANIPKAMVSYYDYKAELEFPDYIASPVPLFSTKLRNVLQIYDEEILYKPIRFFANQLEVKKSLLYWFLYLRQLDCLHETCEKNPNGSIREVILDRHKIMEQDIFRIQGILENKVIVSLPAAESILRRKLYGIGFEKVKVI